MTLLRLRAGDDVAVTTQTLAAGAVLASPAGTTVRIIDDVPAGHKVALADLAPAAPVRKYGQVIGIASRAIRTGEHVHLHNLGMPAPTSSRPAPVADPASATDPTPAREGNPEAVPAGPPARRTFAGIRRADGSVATRNYVGVLATANCAATVVRQVALRTQVDLPPGVDGALGLTHGSGCGMADHGEGWEMLRRTLGGYARHPNIGALLVVGLGCEVNTLAGLMSAVPVAPSLPQVAFTIQDVGGTAAAIEEGVRRVRELAARIADPVREEVGVEHLVLGLQCGGSDAWSGLTANPALGVASDLLVAAGGTSILGETPEVFGAEHLLAARAVSDEVAAALLARIRWWEEYTSSRGTTLDGNPSPGNHAGGITTIVEKSLGAVAKAGSSPLSAVCRYAEPPPCPGLCFMDTPGYDPVSVTGMIAGGATVVAFATGRGSVFGSRPVPTVKLATNAVTARRMAGDIDLDCSPVAEGRSLQEMGRQVYDLLLDVASGRPSAGEALGVGGEELVPWQLGAVL